MNVQIMPNETERKILFQKLSSLQHGNYSFDALAVEVFQYQAAYNEVYKSYLNHIHIDVNAIQRMEQIPFLPIELFKSYSIKTGDWEEEEIFLSSGTGNQIRSQHFVRYAARYLRNTEICFEEQFDSIKEYCYLALLPGYVERGQSSLIKMITHFCEKSKYTESGFYLKNYEELYDQLKGNESNNIPTILFGVSFALLDFVERYRSTLPNTIVMETGGMKGTSKELSKSEIYETLKRGLGVSAIYSEYGMTELFSQAYSKKENIFECAASMRVFANEINDPFHLLEYERQGQLCVIDLANIDSMAFIQTQDIGRQLDANTFSISGRLDISDMRGCNLLLES